MEGVSTPRVKKIVTELCGRVLSCQTISRFTERLYEQVRAWAERPLEEEYPLLVADAMELKVRHQGAVRYATALDCCRLLLASVRRAIRRSSG